MKQCERSTPRLSHLPEQPHPLTCQLMRSCGIALQKYRVPQRRQRDRKVPPACCTHLSAYHHALLKELTRFREVAMEERHRPCSKERLRSRRRARLGTGLRQHLLEPAAPLT